GHAGVRAAAGIVRQRIRVEETVCHDFAVGTWVPVLEKIADDEQGDMVAPRGPFVKVDAEKLRRCAEPDVSFLGELPCKRIEKRFAGLHAAAGKMPSDNICVLDEEDSSPAIDNHGAGAQCRRAREAPVEMHDPADERFKRAAQALQLIHYGRSCRSPSPPVETTNSLFRMIPVCVIKRSASDNEDRA